jgi:ankyrin repeat protein
MTRTLRTRAVRWTLLFLFLIAPFVWALCGKVRQSQRNAALIAAIRRDDALAVKSLLAQRADVNTLDTFQEARLTLLDSIRFLFVPRVYRSQGGPETAMEIALGRYQPDPDSHSAQIVTALLEYGADPRSRERRLSMTLPMLAGLARDPWMLRTALDSGADIHARNQDGRTPLHFAANSGSIEAVDLLLARGADINAVAQDGSPLMCACWGGHYAMMRHLLDRGASLNIYNRHGQTVYDIARRNPRKIRYLALLNEYRNDLHKTRTGFDPIE